MIIVNEHSDNSTESTNCSAVISVEITSTRNRMVPGSTTPYTSSSNPAHIFKNRSHWISNIHCRYLKMLSANPKKNRFFEKRAKWPASSADKAWYGETSLSSDLVVNNMINEWILYLLYHLEHQGCYQLLLLLNTYSLQ